LIDLRPEVALDLTTILTLDLGFDTITQKKTFFINVIYWLSRFDLGAAFAP
jgi:hypothetical protein